MYAIQRHDNGSYLVVVIIPERTNVVIAAHLDLMGAINLLHFLNGGNLVPLDEIASLVD
jgi:hypothetical protein